MAAMHLLYGCSLVAGDETTHDDVLKQHDLKCSQQRVTVQHCQQTHTHTVNDQLNNHVDNNYLLVQCVQVLLHVN